MPSRRTYLRTVATLAGAGLAGCIGPDPGSPSGSDTPTGTLSASPDGPDRVTPGEAAVRWRRSFSRPVVGIALGGHRLHVAASDDARTRGGTPTPGDGARTGSVTAFASDGTTDWRVRTDVPVVRGPTARAGGVYAVVGWDAGLHGVRQRLARFAPDGTRWESEAVDDWLSLAALDRERAYLATSDDALAPGGERLFAVGTDDGATRWSAEAGDAFRGRRHEGRVLVGADWLHAYDATDGSRLWRVSQEPLGAAGAWPTVARGLTFCQSNREGEHGYPLVARSLSDGSARWSYSRPVAAGKNFVPTNAVGVAGTVLGTEYDGLVFGLDFEGTERWTVETGERPALAGGEAAYVGAGGVVRALDPATGAERWRADLGGTFVDLYPADGGIVAAVEGDEPTATGGDEATTVAGFAPDGTERWRVTVGTVRDVATAGRGAYLATGSDVLAVGPRE